MTTFNFRSLLLAAIVLSNCITWTASRHHYAHNVYQHRTRHRRQGAGLYLPASYVIPGGEGGGAWGEWGEVSPCSRTCGGGVASQKRICLQISPDGQPQCWGGDTKYFSCQTQDCPAGSGDFRAEQCAEFDDQAFRGFKYNWVPYTKAPNPCELNCMPHGERFYFRHKLQVTDGTRCNDESFDVCVNGTCQPVGCDMMLGSNAREDKCRECRGNGANCHTTSGIFDSQDLMKGYNDILLIPAGSTTIVIEEVEPSNNYLALRAKNGTYYLNGHYHIDFPRTILIAGALWTYERSQQGYAAPDKLRCIGPTSEPLYLSLLLQDENVGIRYEYSVPNNSAPPTDKRYNWVHEDFTPCSATCGGGFQTRNVTCRSREELELVDDGLCDEGLKPPTNQSCNPDPCPAQWVEGPWGDCSKRCGTGGVRSRNITCEKIITNGNPSIVPDKECFDLLGPKPELFQKCNEDAPCPTWFIGHWRPCDKLCDEGKQTRQVVCYQKNNGRIEVLDDESCTDEKPETEQPCMLQPCDGVDWVTSDWSGCDTCLSTVRTRVVVCTTKGHQVLNDSFCSYHPRPTDQEDCDKSKLPPCEVQWYATQWSKCSVDCGDGIQTRKVFCGLYDGENVAVVEDAKCADLPKYNETKPCTVPKEECPSQWFAGPWTVCTKECGGGEQYRRVMCFRGDKEASDCDGTTVLDSTQLCNTGPCDADETLPVDSKSTPIMDEDEECDESDEDYSEVGLDVDLSGTTLDLMMSDTTATGYGEPESTLETGSGFGSTDDLSTTLEGSGFTSLSTVDTTGTDYSTEDGETGSGETGITESPVSAKTAVTVGVTSRTTRTTEEVSTTESTDVTATGSTGTNETDTPDSSESTESTSETGSTAEETTATGVTEPTGETDSSDVTGNGTETTGVTESTGNDTDATSTDVSISSTESSISTEVKVTGSSSVGSTESAGTEDTASTGTEISGSTESTGSETTSSAEITATGETGSTETEATESTITEETSSTESTVTEETSSTESTVTEETESTVTGETETTSTGSTGSEDTSSTSETEVTTTTETGSSESEETSGSTELTSISGETKRTTIPISTTERTTITASTDSSETTESSSGGSESTEETSTSSGLESTTESGSTSATSEGSESTTVESSSSGSTTESISESTTIGSSTSSGSTEESSTISTEVTESTTGVSESSSSSVTESTVEESSSTVGSESTTEGGSTTEGSSTVSEEITSTGVTESTEESSTTETGSTESTGTEESTTLGSTTEGTTDTGSTEVSGSTTEGLSTSEGSTTEGVAVYTTPWTISTVVYKKTHCKPRRKPKCKKSEFGCCPDKKTAALGPFDEGCPKPRTCKESRHGCCPDGLSPALGENNEGCPVEPCADTLFGCCLSDNKTAAQGNDQDGCPPPPPPCASSEFGCCADNETEATGPEKEGCPESTTTAVTSTETTEETTESIETSEGSTTNEGTTDFTGSTLEPCAGFKYGCCSDNETEAPGPDGQGCPCNATEFGCCPDGVSPAQGTDNEGCPGPCSTSEHGCCQDGQTPAHGPDFEGCCLLQAFGCCPDNRKPAEGPHLEGCGCQYARHGCCPDNVTIAQGPDNKGCGCQYTEHGCCPDRHTAASGPNFEGCACNTYQFGCCNDGITIAKGPDQQGCHCRDSKYGCCGDGETPATGPGAEGCDCASSQHGCCPDGHTDAAGPKFLGCTDAPENKQAVCSMSTDPGPCHNFTAMWYYDLAYGGCSRFWYGGCEGNGNRFATKEDCEDVCVQPAPKDACKLPSVKGPCDADYVRWHFNTTREMCLPFRYGGCLGNANNFDTRDLCQAQCEPSTTAGQCNLPIEQGSCVGNYSRWGFNSETHRCEQFIWGGCEGNSNRFTTEAACQMRCTLAPVQCTEQQDAGNCSNKEALWSFSQTENRCVPFYYSGCGGNSNRFTSREACEQTCPSAYEPDKCTLPAATGECSEYRERWFYDTSIKRCRQFYYGGCGGNENNFVTQGECENACSETKITTTTARPTEPQPQPQTQPAPQQPEPEPERPEFCFLTIDSGPCTNMETRYAYNSELGRCVTFEYGGCGGNQNNFPDETYCTYYCHPIQDICQLPMLAGPCEESLMRWFYDPVSDSCSQFTYGGCEGNDNRFESREACESRCKTGPVATTPTTTLTTPVPTAVGVPAECRVPASLEDCQYGGEVWYFDQNVHECVSHSNQESGAVCRHSGTFTSQEACERSCGAFRGVDVCQQRVDAGPCQEYVTKVYFDAATSQCHEFAYGGCLGGANRFSSMEECAQVCKSEIADPCTLPPEQGNCLSYFEQWYYDATRGECDHFIYTGCGGNENRFESQRECEARCKRPTATTTTLAPTVPPQQTAELECTTPSSLAPCGNNVTVFYYDSEMRQCMVSGIGGCGHPNSYSSEEECERRCGAFRGQDVCGARLDPGPCRASFPKFYWDASSGSCQPYAYGGCNGGPNRFSTAEECQRVCGDTGPALECLQEVDTGESCEAAPAPRWHYSVAHADCVVFAYQGCGGNGNNFYSYDECVDVCRVLRTRGDGSNELPPADCDMLRQECEALVCQYGIDRVVEDGCQKCKCKEDPCVTANCAADERCVAFAVRDPATQEPQYSAKCVPDHETNSILDCDRYINECSSLRCEYGVQRTRMPDGCDRCACVQVEIDCQPLQEECERLKCNYGIERTTGPDGCERCRCKDHPCEDKTCGEGERCVVAVYRDAIDQEPKYTADCRSIVKPGACPMDETTSNEVNCRHECNDDADCRGIGKCCRRGCSALCLLPAEQTSPHPLITTTYAPDVPAAPISLPQQEPEVAAAEGGIATLRCLFHGNPPPKITWRRGELTIDGDAGRYRLTSDGALEIVSLYRNDTGVYICVADNGLGEARQEIHLVVNDPVRTSVGIAGDENAVVTGELGKPLTIRCLAYGYPQPTVFWYRGYESAMVPYNDAVYEARGNVLLIRNLAIETLGQYTCQAYNGEGKAASWVVIVNAYRPEGIFLEHEFLVPRNTVPPMARTQRPTTMESTTTTTTTTTEAPIPMFTVPVSTHVSTPSPTLNIGADLRVTCEVDGFPEPDVYWTKDGVTIRADERTTITGSTIVSRLTVSRATVSDSGLYACHASNPYSSHSDTIQINVQQLIVPAKCTDNPFFANCDLIVRSKFCRHKYYSKFCCKSCVEAGQLDPQEAELQADQPLRKK